MLLVSAKLPVSHGFSSADILHGAGEKNMLMGEETLRTGLEASSNVGKVLSKQVSIF